MSLPVVLRRAARAEFDEAIGWYDRQRHGLGEAFATRVQATLDLIADAPELHATIHRDVRKTSVRQFPYSIFYRMRAGRVVVLAVLHNKRDPDTWRSRA